MSVKNTLVVLLVAALATIALGAPSKSVIISRESSVRSTLESCYSCNSYEDGKLCTDVNEETPSIKCHTGCYVYSDRDREVWKRGCLDKNDEDLCEGMFPYLGDEDVCETCTEDYCNGNNPSPTPRSKCYSCVSTDSKGHCKVIDKGSSTVNCKTSCYTATSEDRKLLERGCFAAGESCAAFKPILEDIDIDTCTSCSDDKCNGQDAQPTPKLKCYSCTTEEDTKHCKDVDKDTATKICGTSCYAASSKDGEKWARGCLKINETCETLLPTLGDKDSCERCTEDNCNGIIPSPPQETAGCNNNIFIALQQIFQKT